MTKIIKTYLEVMAFASIGRDYIEKNSKEENKLCASIRSVLKQSTKVIDEYNEKITDCHLDNCAVDDKSKVILKDEKGNIRFTVEAQKKVNRFQKQLLEETVEIHQRILPENDELIYTLTVDEREVFSGIVISNQPE